MHDDRNGLLVVQIAFQSFHNYPDLISLVFEVKTKMLIE